MTGNIITDVKKCEFNFNACFREHVKLHPECPGDIVFHPQSFSTWGLAISARLKCAASCGYISDKLKFYQEIESSGKGRRAAKINVQLQVILTKQPFGNSAVREVLAAIDTPCPSESGMQKNANHVSDAFRDIAEKQLAKNRKLVKSVMELRGHGQHPIVAQSDVAYNNPIKGRAFYQPGTQSWAPCFAGEPGLEHIPIAFQTRSKVCSCVLSGRDPVIHKEKCEKNFPSSEAMGNSEFHLGKLLAEEMIEGDASLAVGTLVTDGDSHLQRGMNDVMARHGVETMKGDCTRHITKSIARNIIKASLSKRCLGGDRTTAQQRQRSKITLAKFVERRCAMEFRAAWRKWRKCGGRDSKQLEKMCSLAKLGILGCIQGHPDICRQTSKVCVAHRHNRRKSGEQVSV